MPLLEARQRFAANVTPIAITSTKGPQEEYDLILCNAGAAAAYVAASAADAATNGSAIPAGTTYQSGPYLELPYLYAGSAVNVDVQIIGYNEPTGFEFRHFNIVD